MCNQQDLLQGALAQVRAVQDSWTRAAEAPTKGLTFQQALNYVLEGKRVRRAHMMIPGVEFYLGDIECPVTGQTDLDTLLADYPHLGEYGEIPAFQYDDLCARDWEVVPSEVGSE